MDQRISCIYNDYYFYIFFSMWATFWSKKSKKSFGIVFLEVNWFSLVLWRSHYLISSSFIKCKEIPPFILDIYNCDEQTLTCKIVHNWSIEIWTWLSTNINITINLTWVLSLYTFFESNSLIITINFNLKYYQPIQILETNW